MGDAWKAHGNEAFAIGDYNTAVDSYLQGLQAEQPRPPWPFDTELCCALLSNRSEALIRLARYDEALKNAESALELDGAHAKSLVRRRKARQGQKSAKRAVKSPLVPPRRSADWLRQSPPALHQQLQPGAVSTGHMAQISPRLWIGDQVLLDVPQYTRSALPQGYLRAGLN
jgi:tetratricopeptide (TPR) repeat protein